MERIKKRRRLAAVWTVCAMLTAVSGFGTAASVRAKASAYYCDDSYEGSGESVAATYTIEYDDYVEHNEYRVSCAPALNNGGTGALNGCTATAGTNVVAFYDRYYTNLIPNYEPGMSYNGVYRYLPNLGSEAIRTLHTTLYNYMGVNAVVPGATEDDFKNGLKRYVNEQGYSISYDSMYESAKTVNLAKVRQMVQSNKVAVVFCMGYNFVNYFDVTETSRTVYLRTCDAGHVMMIYGYFTVDYYKDNQIFLTETYLCASSCSSIAEKGYIKLNDYGTIDDAVMITIG